MAGVKALGEPVEIFEVDELAPPAADEVLLDVAAILPLAEAATALRDAVTGRSKGANVLTLDRS